MGKENESGDSARLKNTAGRNYGPENTRLGDFYNFFPEQQLNLPVKSWLCYYFLVLYNV